mmetsp:Transcript_39495/g.92409  ORF Transcript_39495/g.92409 Transcript_39495/m.92409 type:complete len:214 (-) Transcript_39495:403-1044(-)
MRALGAPGSAQHATGPHKHPDRPQTLTLLNQTATDPLGLPPLLSSLSLLSSACFAVADSACLCSSSFLCAFRSISACLSCQSSSLSGLSMASPSSSSLLCFIPSISLRQCTEHIAMIWTVQTTERRMPACWAGSLKRGYSFSRHEASSAGHTCWSMAEGSTKMTITRASCAMRRMKDRHTDIPRQHRVRQHAPQRERTLAKARAAPNPRTRYT